MLRRICTVAALFVTVAVTVAGAVGVSRVDVSRRRSYSLYPGSYLLPR